MAGAKSAGYKLATYKSSEGPRAGIIVGNEVFDAAKLTGKAGYATVMGILADWKAAEPALKKAAAGAAKSRAKRQPLAKTKLLAPLRGKVNLIFFNAFEGAGFVGSSRAAVEDFQAILRKGNLTATIRESRGLDIAAACGQLYAEQAH